VVVHKWTGARKRKKSPPQAFSQEKADSPKFSKTWTAGGLGRRDSRKGTGHEKEKDGMRKARRQKGPQERFQGKRTDEHQPRPVLLKNSS